MNELIIELQDGDKEAFTELVMIIEKDLYRITRARLNNEFDIKE